MRWGNFYMGLAKGHHLHARGLHDNMHKKHINLCARINIICVFMQFSGGTQYVSTLQLIYFFNTILEAITLLPLKLLVHNDDFVVDLSPS
jgi:hypothetical protein